MFSKNFKVTKKLLSTFLILTVLLGQGASLIPFAEKAYAEAGESVTTNLVNWYKFNDNTGLTATDSQAPAADATLTNGAAWSTDVPPNTNASPNTSSVLLDGVNDYVVSSNSPGLPTGDFTYTAWVKPADGTDGTIIMASNGGLSLFENELIIDVIGTKVRIYTNNVIRLTGTIALAPAQWSHVAVTRSGSAINLYVNGQLDAQNGIDAGALSFSTCPLIIGMDSDGAGCLGVVSDQWNGNIDDVRVYSSALTQVNIQSIFNDAQNGITLSAPGGFTSTVKAWFKADYGTSASTNTASLYSWKDASGNNNDVYQEVVSEQPKFSTQYINFNPTIDFDDGDSFYRDVAAGEIFPNAGNDAVTGYVIGVEDVQSGFTDFLSMPTSITGFTDDYSITELSGKPNYWMNTASTFDPFVPSLNIDVSTPFMTGSSRNVTTAAGTPNYYMFNGSRVSNILGAAQDISPLKLILGAENNNNFETLDGRIAEVVLFNQYTQTANDKLRIESYLASKYGMTLSQVLPQDYIASDGTTKIWDATIAASYKNNITVIGRDDASALLQKQSKSVNVSGLVTIGKSLIATDNKSNPSSFVLNKDFVSFADNGGSAFNFTNIGAPANKKIVARNWKVSEVGTNAIDYVISVPDNSSTLITKLPLETKTVYMLIDADGNFASGATEIPMTLVGTEWRTAAIDLNNGQFFTFATRDVNPGGVAGASLWTKANEAGCAEGANCTSWQDNSTNANPVESTAGGKILFASDAAHNFNPYFTNFSSTAMFVDDNGSISPDGVQTNTDQTIFAAARATSAGTGRIVAQDNESPALSYAGEPGLGIQGGAQHFYRFWNTTQSISSTNAVTTNKTSVFDWRTGGTSLTMGLDGKNTTHAITAQTTWGNTVNIGYGLYPAVGTSGAGPFPGDIQEVIWYNTSVSNIDKQKINSYLSTKYGVTLDQVTAQNYIDSNGAIYWNATTAGAYNKNITVIGRDDASGLEQKQSKSVNVASLVTVGKSVILASNAINTGVFAADKDYLSLADNGTAITGFSATGAPADKNIIARTWKAQEVGTNAIDYKISIPDNTSTLTTKLPQDNGNIIYFVKDIDGNFAAGATFVPMTLVGTNWELTNVDLSAGDHFTFAINAPGVTTGPGLTMLETASGTVSVVLDAVPAGNVVVNLISSDTGAATVAPATMTFTNTNWNVPQIATVTGVIDADTLNENVNITATVNAALSSNEYDAVPADIIPIVVTDTNVAGFSVSTTAVTMSENGGTQNFTVVLTSQPSSNVVLNVVSGSILEGTVSVANLTFTSLNWNIAQTVTVAGLNDNLDKIINDTSLIIVSVDAALSDNAFDTLVGQTVNATFTDDDIAGVTVTPVDNLTGEDGATGSYSIVLRTEPLSDVTINFSSTNAAEGTGLASVTFTPLNWNVVQNIVVTGIDDVIPTSDGAIIYSIVTGDVTSTLDTIYDAMDGTLIPDIVMQNQDNDAPAVTLVVVDGDTSESGSTAKVQFRLLAQPAGGADLTIPLSISNTAEGTISVSSITILNANWNIPTNNEVTITGVDDLVQDGTISYLLVTGDPTSTDLIQDSLTAANVADANISNSDNDVAGVTITQTGSDTNVTEGNITDTYSVVLNTAPTSNVVVTMNAGSQVTTSLTNLTFTSVNYNIAQVVTVTAIDDTLLENAHTGTITHTTASADSNYNNLTVATVVVNITDNEVADTTAPSIPIVNSVNSGDITITGTGEVGATVNVTGATCTNAPVIVSAGGIWVCNLAAPLSASTTFTVTQTDNSNNVSAPTNVTVTAVVIPDTSAPSAPTINPIDNNDTTLSGTGEPGSTVNVTGATCTNAPVIVQANGTWSCTLAAVITTGTTITITQTDTAGNASAPATTDVANAVTVLATSTPVTVNPVGNTDTQITGIAAPGSTINVTGATCTNAPVIANAAGAYTCNLASSPTAGDIITVTATEIGKAPSAPSTTTVSNAVTTAPSAPSVNLTNGSTLSGTGEPGSTVNVTGATCTNAPVTVQVNGTWVCNISPAPSNGSTVTVTQTDNGGNVSGPTSVIVDSIAPSAPIVNPVTSTTNPIIGTGTPGNTITVTGATCTNAPIIIQSNGAWACNLAANPALGATITVTESDLSGNISVPTYSTVPGAVTPSSGGGSAGGIIAFLGNLVQSAKDLLANNNTNNNQSKPLTGGVEANIPAEFAAQVCKRYLTEYILPGKNNNIVEVKKLQEFLNQNQGEKLVIDGTYDADDIEAIKRFQSKYASQILYPWGETKPTGRVFRTTTAKINLMSCQKSNTPYFTEYLKLGDSSLEVVRLQDFLNIIFAPTSGYPTKGLKLTKVFDVETAKKLREYQEAYKDTVLKPWDLKTATGRFYQTTRASANNLVGATEGEVKLDNGVSVR